MVRCGMEYNYGATAYNYEPPVYTKNLKDVPERLLRHRWQPTVDFSKLPKYQLKVRMCCHICVEKVLEEIWEVPGVFDVIADRLDRKVVVTSVMPESERGEVVRCSGMYKDEWKNEVLRKAKKIDCRAKFVKLDPVTKSKPDDSKSKPDGSKSKPDLIGTPGLYGSYPIVYTSPPPRKDRQDDNAPFYFLLLVIFLLCLLVFSRK